MSFTLRKKYIFEASHQLKNHDGKCARLHGHSWSVVVEIRGNNLIHVGPKQNMLFDYGSISAVVKPIIDNELDHHHLNDVLSYANDMPTSEYLAEWLFKRIAPAIESATSNLHLRSITIGETCTSECTYTPFD